MPSVTKPAVILPVIHQNGTSAERLQAALDDAYRVIGEALDKLKECAPNGRDYYLDPGRMELAVAQHRSRMQRMKDVQDEIEAEVQGIEEQEDSRCHRN